MATLATAIARGARGSQPAASAVSIGSLYCITDEGNIVERSNGATWDAFSPSGAGTVTNAAALTSGKVVEGAGSNAVAVSTLTATVVKAATGTLSAATANTDYLAPAGYMVCGRLTTESGVPVSTTDRTAQGTIYWTPYNGDTVPVYTGSAWKRLAFSEISLALSGLTSGKNYDVFVYDNSGTLALELSAAWTNDTTRADALALQNGLYVKSGTTTRLWVGTIRTTSTTTTEDSGGITGTTQVGGKRFVWNAYNQVDRSLTVLDSTDSWAYTTQSWRQANAASGNKVEYVTGDVATLVQAQILAGIFVDGLTSGASVGVGIDSTTVRSGFGSQVTSGSGSRTVHVTAAYRGSPGLGYHAVNWLEYGAGGTGCTFLGDNAGTSFGANQQSGLLVTLRN